MSNIILGNSDTKFKVGSGDCSIYLGTNLLYSPTPHDYSLDYLTFEPISSAVTFSNYTKQLSYSLDSGSTWSTLPATNTVTVDVGEKIMLKGTFTGGNDDNYANRFVASGGTWKAYGNVLSLAYSDSFTASTSSAITNAQFIGLFSGCTNLSDVDNLKMPAKTAGQKSLRSMFRGCSGLTQVPSDLFSTFTAFTDNSTCMGMFEECTSLLESPIIPNISIPMYGLYYMFFNCSSLSACTCLITSNIGWVYTENMVGNTASNGVFYKHPNATWSSSDNGMPNGWTIQDYSG